MMFLHEVSVGMGFRYGISVWGSGMRFRDWSLHVFTT